MIRKMITTTRTWRPRPSDRRQPQPDCARKPPDEQAPGGAEARAPRASKPGHDIRYLCVSHRICEEHMGTALLGASSTEMMQDFPLHVSDGHLNKPRLINSLWTKVSERSEGV